MSPELAISLVLGILTFTTMALLMVRIEEKREANNLKT